MPILLRCSTCRQAVPWQAELATCANCGAGIPATLGIPDLRGPHAPTTPSETALVRRLLDLYPSATLEDLIEERLRSRPIGEEVRQHRQQHTLSMTERGSRFYRLFREQLAAHFAPGGSGAALDLGCGAGASLPAMAANFDVVVGLDYDLSALILAKKLLETLQANNVLLVQGTALDLPFPSSQFDHVNALNVLEHVLQPDLALREVFRALRPGGTFSADSRNRYDLLFREPHVHLRWLGYLPRRWMPAYVRWRRKMSYDHTRLLSYGELRAGLKATFGESWRIVLPAVSAYGAPSWADRLLESITRLSLARPVLLRIFPSHLALARRIA